MPTYQQQAELQALINAAMAQPGGPTPAQAARAAQMAEAGGFTPQDLSRMSGGAYTEDQVRASAGDLSTTGQAAYNTSSYAPGQTTTPTNPYFNGATHTGGANSSPSGYSGSGDNVQTIRSETAIPDYLQPFVNESTNFSLGSLYSLGDVLSRPNATISPFNANQLEAQNKAAAVARGDGGYVNQAQDVFREVADGSDIQALATRGQNLLENSAGRSGLNAFSQSSGVNPTAMSALESIAGGGGGHGSAGFNSALQASMDAARPIIASTFSSGGSGGLKSGLAQTAMQKAASDSFANLYGQNQNNQLAAANTLGGLSLSGRGLQQNAASQLMGADQQAGSIYSQLANADRSRQVTAAGMLPQVGLMGSSILGNVGQQQQTQDERQKMGAINQYQQLLNASFGKVDPSLLLGNNSVSSQQTSSNKAGGILGGAMTGAKIGGMFGGPGAAIGAIGGGLLGGFG